VSEDDGENEDLGRGTLIKIHLKEGEEEYADQDRLKSMVSRYSEFIDFPIYLQVGGWFGGGRGGAGFRTPFEFIGLTLCELFNFSITCRSGCASACCLLWCWCRGCCSSCCLLFAAAGNWGICTTADRAWNVSHAELWPVSAHPIVECSPQKRCCPCIQQLIGRL
jgi:hypothetical protein